MLNIWQLVFLKAMVIWDILIDDMRICISYSNHYVDWVQRYVKKKKNRFYTNMKEIKLSALYMYTSNIFLVFIAIFGWEDTTLFYCLCVRPFVSSGSFLD